MKRYFRTPYLLPKLLKGRVWGFKNDKVYLTFDDGPTSELTYKILEVLDEYQIKATFFLVGNNVNEFPKQFASIVKGGHSVGNHTMDHSHCNKVLSSAYMKSIEEASQLISSDLFRPPYGRLNVFLAPKIKRKYKIIMWSWLSYDYDKSVSTKEIISQAQKIKAGDILVLHDNIKVEERVIELLPEIIKIVRNKGLEFDIISSYK